jgi:hypothetical protein
MNYEIRIGIRTSSENLLDEPVRIIVVSEDQRNILIHFAERTLNENGDTWYKIGACKFTISLHFGEEKYFKQPTNETKASA